MIVKIHHGGFDLSPVYGSLTLSNLPVTRKLPESAYRLQVYWHRSLNKTTQYVQVL
jgi:hypothetical protein